MLRTSERQRNQVMAQCACVLSSRSLAFSPPSSLSERTDFSAGKVDGKLMPCLRDSSELIAGSVNNGSQVQDD
jgi:hypothetical protein